MTVRGFVRWALAAPVLVAPLAFPLLTGERDPFDTNDERGEDRT